MVTSPDSEGTEGVARSTKPLLGRGHYSLSLDAPAPGTDVFEPQSVADSFGDADDRFELVEVKLALAGAISRLPYLERQALTLRIEHDMKQTDIAARLGCSQMQVSRLLRRAICSVKALIDPDVSSGTTLASPRPPDLVVCAPRGSLGHPSITVMTDPVATRKLATVPAVAAAPSSVPAPRAGRRSRAA